MLSTCSWLGSVCCFLLSTIFLTTSSRSKTWARLLSTATSTRQESGISATSNQKKLFGQSERRNRLSCLHSKSVWYNSKRSCSKKLSAVGQSFLVSNSSWICSFFPCISYSHRSECVPHNASVLAMQFPSACWRRSVPVSCRLAGSMRCCTLFNSSTSSVLMLVTTSPNKPTSAMPFQKFSVSSAGKQTTQSNLTH